MESPHDLADPTPDTGLAAAGAGEASPAEPSLAPADAVASGDAAADAAEGGPGGERPRKPRRDPNEAQFGGLFLDELQRSAGLRGQFAYGLPQKLWRANREQTIRLLREAAPMPTFKNQIHCILTSDPIELAHDVHLEMLSAPTPTSDSFRWLWLHMMVR